MQLIIAHRFLHIADIPLNNTHVLLLSGHGPNRAYARFPMLYSPSKEHISSKDVPYTSEKRRFMDFNKSELSEIETYQQADFGGFYRSDSSDSEVFDAIPGAWIEHDEHGRVVDHCSNVMDILARLSRNNLMYSEVAVLVPLNVTWAILLAKQILFEHMKTTAPIFFAQYIREDNPYSGAFARRHDTPWTEDCPAELVAQRTWLATLAAHWFRENSYVVFSKLLMEAFEHPEKEFKAMHPIDLQILFYLAREKHMNLDTLIDQVDFTYDKACSLADKLPGDFDLSTCIHEIAQFGFLQKHTGAPYWTLSEVGKVLLYDLFNTELRAQKLADMAKKKTALGLVITHPDGTTENTHFGAEYARQLSCIKNNPGFVVALQAINNIIDRSSGAHIELHIVHAELHKKVESSRTVVKPSLERLQSEGIVEFCTQSKTYSLTSQGTKFIHALHPRTLDPAAFGRTHKWISTLNKPSIKRYVNTIFGRQELFSKQQLRARTPHCKAGPR